MSDVILDAAREVFERFGVRRANVDDIAQHAGISRSTLYRAYPSKQALLAAVLERESDRFFDELDAVAAGLAPQEAVIECFEHGMAMVHSIPVLSHLARTDPGVITGSDTSRSVLLLHTDRVVRTLRRAGARMPDDELGMVAELMLRLAGTYLFDDQGFLDVDDPDAVRDYAKRFLSPLVE